jgi:hypothetical protein
MQFAAKFFNRFLKAFEPGERECNAASALRERLSGVDFPEPDQFSDGAADVNALVWKRNRRIGAAERTAMGRAAVNRAGLLARRFRALRLLWFADG